MPGSASRRPTADALAVLAAALGLATAIVHLGLPPGSAIHSPGGVAATLQAPTFLPAVILGSGLVALVGIVGRRWLGRRATVTLLIGLGGLLAIPLLDRLLFRCPVWSVLAAVGALTCWRWSRLQQAALLAESAGEAGDSRARGLVVATVVAVGFLVLAGSPGAQGDEPHYLLVTHSIWQDGDIDLADDYGDREDLAFHRGAISPHYKPGVREGSRFSIHGVGYPVLLLPAYAAGRALSLVGPVALSRALQVLAFGLLAWLLIGFVRPVAPGRTGRLAVVLTLCLAPLVFAPVNLFPETPAMLLSCAAFLAVSRRRQPAAELLAGLALAALPWLGVKYIPLAGATAIGALVAGGGSLGWARAARVCGPLAAALLGHGAFTWVTYGTWSPSAIYLGADPGFGRQPGYGSDWRLYVADWPGALRTLVGYFFDQKEGLFFLAPHFMLAAAGLPLLWRERRRELLGVLLITAAHLAPYALSQQIGGQSPPARPLMAILWIWALPLAAALALRGGRLLVAMRGALPVLSAAITLTFILDPRLLPHDYQITESWLLRALSPAGTELWRAFPLWLNLRGNAQWIPTLLWTAALLVLMLALVWGARRAADVPLASTRTLTLTGAGAALCLVTLVSAHAASLVVSERHASSVIAPGVHAYVVGSVPEGAWLEAGGIWVAPGPTREILLLLEDWKAESVGSSLPIRLRTLRDGVVRIGAAGRWERREQEAGPATPHDLELGRAFRWRERDAYRILLGASDGVEPARVDGGADWRPLGVLLQLRQPRERGGE